MSRDLIDTVGAHLFVVLVEKCDCDSSNTHVTIEEQFIYPTNQQARASLRVCQMLSSSYRNIELFRFDEQTGVVFIFAGEELQIIIPSSGLWRFLDATEL